MQNLSKTLRISQPINTAEGGTTTIFLNGLKNFTPFKESTPIRNPSVASSSSVAPLSSSTSATPASSTTAKRRASPVVLDCIFSPIRANSSANSTPHPQSARTSPETIQINTQDDEIRFLWSQLNIVDLVSNELIEVLLESDTTLQKNQELMSEIEGLQKKLDALEKNSFPLSFVNLQPGHVLGDVVDKFTFFPTYKANIAFLHLINFTNSRPEGDGLCENMRHYSFVSMHAHKNYNNISDSDMSISDIEESSDDETKQVDGQSKKGHNQMFDWKTEWLIFCINACCGISQERIAPLFEAKSPTTIHNIIYVWKNLFY
ncbi:hypothetical protein ACHAWX_001184 [Stephanocyclus meneghinianus]